MMSGHAPASGAIAAGPGRRPASAVLAAMCRIRPARTGSDAAAIEAR